MAFKETAQIPGSGLGLDYQAAETESDIPNTVDNLHSRIEYHQNEIRKLEKTIRVIQRNPEIKDVLGLF